MKANKEIREKTKKYNVPYWKIAIELGVHESTINRKLRVELSPEEKQVFLGAIEKIVKEEGGTYE